MEKIPSFSILGYCRSRKQSKGMTNLHQGTLFEIPFLNKKTTASSSLELNQSVQTATITLGLNQLHSSSQKAKAVLIGLDSGMEILKRVTKEQTQKLELRPKRFVGFISNMV